MFLKVLAAVLTLVYQAVPISGRASSMLPIASVTSGYYNLRSRQHSGSSTSEVNQNGKRSGKHPNRLQPNKVRAAAYTPEMQLSEAAVASLNPGQYWPQMWPPCCNGPMIECLEYRFSSGLIRKELFKWYAAALLDDPQYPPNLATEKPYSFSDIQKLYLILQKWLQLPHGQPTQSQMELWVRERRSKRSKSHGDSCDEEP
jgi:hypothetical protein